MEGRVWINPSFIDEGDIVKFRCERDVLVDALASVGRATTGRGGSLPVLSGARMRLESDRLELTGSDLDMTIQVWVDVSGQSDGMAVAPARLTSDIVRALEPGAVEVEANDDQLRISAGRSQFEVRVFSVDDYPTIAEPEGEPVVLPAADFAEGLSQVVPASSNDDARPILTGVLLSAEEDGLRLVSTDSYRLAVRDLEGTIALAAGQKVLVPSRALGELVRFMGDSEQLSLYLGERDVAFELADHRVQTRLIEGEFPNYRQLIPSDYPNRLTVGREALLDALRRVKLLAREATPVRLGQHESHVELTATTQDVGQASETVEAAYEGEELTVAFNPDYLLEGLEASGGDDITLETRDALKPAVIRPVGRSDYLYLLMPVRVS